MLRHACQLVPAVGKVPICPEVIISNVTGIKCNYKFSCDTFDLDVVKLKEKTPLSSMEFGHLNFLITNYKPISGDQDTRVRPDPKHRSRFHKNQNN